jgi:tRNA A-37 threonylcarbamoyl transferase component Bud32
MPEIEPGSKDYWRHVEEIFHAALDLPAPERPEFLRAHCGGQKLEQEVRELLEGYETQERLRANVPADPAAGRRYGPYEVIRKIGAGGMGEVYLAQRREDFELRVAIKVIANSQLATPLLIERFRQERQILATLDHPNIARLLDGGLAESGQPYLVMEYVEGIRLDRYCDQHALTLEPRLALFRKVCAAVECAHGKLVVHRDLKPNNILVNEQGEPKLLDFGVAKVLESEAGAAGDTLTVTGALLLTPRYASPERLAGAPATVASDVYSLGVILYELLSGQSPYAGSDSSPAKLIGAMMTRELAPPSTVAPEALRRPLRGGLDRIAGRALGKRPEDRYESVAQLSADIERFLAGRAVKRGARRRLWVPVAVAVALLCAVAFWILVRAGQKPFDPPPFSLAVPPATTTAAAADLRNICEAFALDMFTTLLRSTRGISLIDWKGVSAVGDSNGQPDARARLPVALILETQLDRRDGVVQATLRLYRRRDGAVLWSATAPLGDPRNYKSAATALAAGRVAPFLEQEFNIAAYERATGERRQSILQGSAAAVDPCAEKLSPLRGLARREGRVDMLVRTVEARSTDTRIEVLAGAQRAFPSAAIRAPAGVPIPIRAPEVVQLAQDTCVLTDSEGDIPVYADRCIVPPAGESGLFLRYLCAAKAHPIDISGFANAWGAWNEETFPSGARMVANVPFLIPNGKKRFWSAGFTDGGGRPVTLTIPITQPGASKVYLLMNTLWGRPGPQSYIALTFVGDGGARFEKKLVGNVDVRDFAPGEYTTTINGTTTKEVFNNGRGQVLDMIEVDLPEAFRSQTLESIAITDTGRADFQRAALWGVTVQ